MHGHVEEYHRAKLLDVGDLGAYWRLENLSAGGGRIIDSELIRYHLRAVKQGDDTVDFSEHEGLRQAIYCILAEGLVKPGNPSEPCRLITRTQWRHYSNALPE